MKKRLIRMPWKRKKDEQNPTENRTNIICDKYSCKQKRWRSAGQTKYIIEKHITDRNSRNGTDGSSAIEIKNYKRFVSKCNEAKVSLGDGKRKQFSKDELTYRKYSKKIILYKSNLKKNHILKFEDLLFLRSMKKRS